MGSQFSTTIGVVSQFPCSMVMNWPSTDNRFAKLKVRRRLFPSSFLVAVAFKITARSATNPLSGDLEGSPTRLGKGRGKPCTGICSERPS